MLGCDPEFFLTKRGRIIGSEKLVPEEGLGNTGYTNSRPIVIQDGVQVEINPVPNTCRQSLSSNIGSCFRHLKGRLDSDSKYKGIKLDFSQAVEISERELATLSPKNQVLGCNPSFCVYESEHEVTVDPKAYRVRSAGGHIHLGRYAFNFESDEAYQKYKAENKGVKGADHVIKVEETFRNPEKLVKLMDIIVGNTCVLLDRHEGNIERRKVYGMAGEFRTPKHGLEYRTLSNFWLRHYSLMSIVFSLSRFAFILATNGKADEFIDALDMRNVRDAINKNDFDMARDNMKAIKKLWLAYADGGACCINRDSWDAFQHVVDKGIENYFKVDPFEHWVALDFRFAQGAESFLSSVAGGLARASATVASKKAVTV